MADLTATAVPTTEVAPSPEPVAASSSSLSEMFTAPAASQPGGSAAIPPADTSSPPVSSPNYAAQAAELGIQLPATATTDEVFAAMQSRLKEYAPLAGYAQSLLPHAEEINRYFASNGQAPAAPTTPAPAEEWTPEAHFSKVWNAPKLTPDMQFALQNGMVEREPSTGLMVAKPGFEVMVTPLLAGLNQAINWEREAVREHFAGNPYRKTYEALKDPIERLVEEKVVARLAAVRNETATQQTIGDFEARNQDFLYQTSNSGERMLTPQGTQFVQMVRALQPNWSGDAGTLLALCRSAVQSATAPATAQEAATAPSPAPAPAAVKPAEHSAGKKQSFLDTALRQASHQASGGANAVNTPDGPVVLTQRELEDVFLSDHRARAV